jgi:hypothetical protein
MPDIYAQGARDDFFADGFFIALFETKPSAGICSTFATVGREISGEINLTGLRAVATIVTR